MTAKKSRKAKARDDGRARWEKPRRKNGWPRRYVPEVRFEEVARFVELLSGDANSLECFHAIKRGVGGRHVHGSITDGEVSGQLETWNMNGFEIYITAHALYNDVTHSPNTEDISDGRALFIDSDGEPKPDQWHLPPDFIIEREDDPDHNWWAFWIMDSPFPTDQIEHYQRRIAELYGTDPSVSDARRIVRLPGLIRHKHNEGPNKKNAAEGDTIYRYDLSPGRGGRQ